MTIDNGGVWLRPQRPQREAPPLTRDRIVREAVALLDEEGAARLTMRRLAERLGTGSTTLYWHVATKDDVIDLALDAVFAEVEPLESGEWRERVSGLLGAWRATMLRHRWSAALLGRPLLGPNVLARTEFLHATLFEAGFRGERLSAAAFGLANYVIGSAIMEASWLALDPAQARAAGEYLRTQRADYPTLLAHPQLYDNDWDANFTRGLGYLLDGMQAELDR